MAGILDKFFTNMLLGGIITRENGINYMWHNPFAFFPSKSFASFYVSLEKNIKFDELHEVFYWLGYLQGRNSTQMMKNRFGIDKSKVASFIEGASLVGMGDLKLVSHEENYMYGDIEGTNSIFALKVKELNGSIKHPVDSYIAGVLAGGAEILFDKKYRCTEKKCMINGCDRCVYHLEANKSFDFKVLKKRLKKFDIIEKNIIKQYLNKAAFVKISPFNEFSYSNGAFYCKKIQGYDMEVYLFVLMNELLGKINEKQYKIALRNMFSDIIKDNFSESLDFSGKNLAFVFEKLNFLGFGNFVLKNSSKNVMFFECKNSPFASEYVKIFGRSKSGVDSFIELFIETAINDLFKKKSKVVEVSCVASGKSSCLFKIAL